MHSIRKKGLSTKKKGRFNTDASPLSRPRNHRSILGPGITQKDPGSLSLPFLFFLPLFLLFLSLGCYMLGLPPVNLNIFLYISLSSIPSFLNRQFVFHITRNITSNILYPKAPLQTFTHYTSLIQYKISRS